MTIRFKILPSSLKKQLVLCVLSALFLVWGTTAYLGFKSTRNEIAELFNAELAQSARVVQAFVENMLRQRALTKLWEHDKTPDLFDMPILEHKYERKIAFQLRSVKGGLVLRSESAPDFALSENHNGYSETIIHDRLWHVFSLSSESGEYVIHVGQRDDIRKELAETIASEQIIGFIVAIPILGIVIWVIVSSTLKPVNQLKTQLASREVQNLKPLTITKLPQELLPVVEQINSLFALLEQAFTNERNFSSDASHELKTPLAGLLTQVQVAQKTTDIEVRNQALAQAQSAIFRMTHMVQQLLTLSRVQQNYAAINKQRISLHPFLIDLISQMDVLAHEKQIEIELKVENEANILANPQLMEILIRNLLDNAIKYAPFGGQVCIQLLNKENQVYLLVEDNGPGVSDTEYLRIKQRFYRCVATARAVEGSGLGLSIVERIINLHSAKINFSRSLLGGLKVEIIFEPFSS